MKTITWTSLAMALVMLVTPAFAEEDPRPEKGKRGERRKEMREKRGEGEKDGDSRREMQRKQMMSLPGAKEIIEAHQKAIMALNEKAKETTKAVHEEFKGKEEKPAKEEIAELMKEKLKPIATEMVDERISFAQKMVDLQKANKEDAVQKTVNMMLMRIGKAFKDRKQRGVGDDENNAMPRKDGDRKPRRDKPRRNNDEAAKTDGGGDIADDLEKALQ